MGEVKEGEPFTPRTKKSFTNRTNLCVGGGPLKDPLHQIKSPRVTLSQNVSQYVNSVEGRSARLVLVSLVMQALVLHGGRGMFACQQSPMEKSGSDGVCKPHDIGMHYLCHWGS